MNHEKPGKTGRGLMLVWLDLIHPPLREWKFCVVLIVRICIVGYDLLHARLRAPHQKASG